jgi:hypothetical protein
MGRLGMFAMYLAAFLGFDGSDDLPLNVLAKKSNQLLHLQIN